MARLSLSKFRSTTSVPGLAGETLLRPTGRPMVPPQQIQVIGLIVLSLKYSKFISYIVWSLHFYEEKQSFK